MKIAYIMETADELIEMQEHLQAKGYELADYDKYFGREIWTLGNHEVVLQFAGDEEEEE